MWLNCKHFLVVSVFCLVNSNLSLLPSLWVQLTILLKTGFFTDNFSLILHVDKSVVIQETFGWVNISEEKTYGV